MSVSSSLPKPYKRTRRWHILIFLMPAILIYTLFMIFPLADTLRLSFFSTPDAAKPSIFVGMKNYITIFAEGFWSKAFWNALWNNTIFFGIHMLVQNPIGLLLAALLSTTHLPGRTFYRTAIFIPTMLSFVIVGFLWKLILSNNWGVARSIMEMVGLKSLYSPKLLGDESTALITLSMISVWQFVGIPMMLIYAALLSIPEELTEAANCDGMTGFKLFWKIKLPLILPTLGIISILTFVANFNAFDLIYVTQGALASPDSSTDILGTLMYRTFYGLQNQVGDTNMGATIATLMFLIILIGVGIYLYFVQRRLHRYQF